MNAERLHAIAREALADLDETRLEQHVSGLADQLDRLVTAPQDPGAQASVAEARKQLKKAVDASSLRSLSPLWTDVLVETGVWRAIGPPLAGLIDAAFVGQDLTPHEAATRVRKAAGQVLSIRQVLTNLINAFEVLDIGAEELAPGEAEIGVLIPRGAVKEGLNQLGNEFAALQRILGPFSELATGSRPELKVRSISSSEFGVFIALAPAVAALIGTTIERLLNAYEKFLRIRQLRKEMRDQGVPEESLIGVSDHAESQMADAIVEIVEAALADANASIEQGRRNELRIEFKRSVESLAGRIDVGFNFEVRAEPPEKTEEGEEDGDDQLDVYAAIDQLGLPLQFRRMDGEPILRLPHSASEDTVEEPRHDPDAAVDE